MEADAPRCDRAELRELSAAVLAVTQQLSVREVLQTIVSAARRLLRAEYAALGVPDDHGSFAEFVVDGVSDEQWRAIGPLPRQHGMLAVMLREAVPQRLADIRADPRFEWWPAAHPVLRDFLGMPIMNDGQILGALYLANKTAASGLAGATATGAGGFTADDEDLLGLLAAHAAIALTNARLYEYSRELTVVAERTRIARELHDSVSQKLFSLRLTAEAAAALVGRDPARVVAELDNVRALAAEAAEELRAVVVELRPPDLAGDNLATALRRQVQALGRVSGVQVRLSVDGYHRLPPAREEAALRIAQEALHNALRHAAASRIDVRLSGRTGGGAVLEVDDDGAGFDPDEVHGSGLRSMRERATAVGAALAVRSRPGEGARVLLEVPGG